MCIVFFFKGQSFFIALGVGWRIFGRTHGSRGDTWGGGGRISFRQKSIKRHYRKLTANGESGRGSMMRILESLKGESGKFYLTQLKSSSMQQLPFLSQQLVLRVLVHFWWKWVNLSSPDAAFRTDPKELENEVRNFDPTLAFKTTVLIWSKDLGNELLTAIVVQNKTDLNPCD